jgi:hypothetical protein
VLGALLAHPRYIADFNWLVGGRARGHAISVIGEDWGQDLNLLGKWQREKGVPVRYFTAHRMRYAEVKHAGGEVNRLPCYGRSGTTNWVAVHLTDLVRRSCCVRRYLDRETDVVLNDHILLLEPPHR